MKKRMTIKKIKMLWTDEEGASVVEYAVLLAGIISVCAAAIFLIGPILQTMFSEFEQSIP